MQIPKNLKVGDQFRVIVEDSDFDMGEIITLESDDGTDNPFFWNADKSDACWAHWSEIEPYAKTIRDAQVDDVVIGKSGDEYMVLERGQNTVMLSQANDFKKTLDSYHFDELEAQFTLKAAPVVDDNVVLTMSQIAEKFGVDVSKLKIAKD